MKVPRTLLVLVVLALLLALVPSASACIQVYPWSELCQGDVQGFLEAWLP